MNLKVGDKVVVISGKSKGSEGKIIKTFNDIFYIFANLYKNRRVC